MGRALGLVLVSERSRNPANTAMRLLAPYDTSIELRRQWRDYLSRGELREYAKDYGIPVRNVEAIARRLKRELADYDVGVDGDNRIYVLRSWNRHGFWDWYYLLTMHAKTGKWIRQEMPRRVLRVADVPTPLWERSLDELPCYVVTPRGHDHWGVLSPWREDRAVRAWRRKLRGLLMRYRKAFVLGVIAHM